VVGPDIRIAIDANQRWNVDEAITWTKALAEFEPYWIEEPTSPDDVLGHAAVREAVAPVKVATGEHVQNRVVFKQLLQAGAIDVLQIDAARVAGVNENLAILLLAAKFGVPVCPHAGGVGLCELVQHLSMFDFVALSGTTDDRVIEYVDHLHDHFLDPVVIRQGHYTAPTAPGFSATMRPQSIAEFTYPGGTFWAADLAHQKSDSQPSDKQKGEAA
jgi:L-fuconate dehydratase